MHTIESYSKYLHQLVKDGKYENVLINFNENRNNFRKEEISNNRYLVSDLLRSFKEQSNFKEALQFMKDYEIDVFNLKDSFVISQYGWLLNSILKQVEDDTDVAVEAEGEAIAFLGRMSFLDEDNRLLITQVFGKILSRLRKQKHVDAIKLTELLKSINIKHDGVKNLIRSEPFLVSNMMEIFRKSGHVERVFGLPKFLNISIDADTSEHIRNSYGWTLYSRLKLEMNDHDDDDSDTPFDSLLVDLELEPIVNSEIADLHPNNETLNLISNCISLFPLEALYSPFSRLFNLSLKFEKHKSNPNWAWMEIFLIPFKGQSLSEKCETIEFIKAGKPKKVELASDMETWYSYYSLALLKLKKYQECIEVSKDALFKLEKFHYNNDLWFARKIALSNRGLGNVSQAIFDMEKIERRKSEWFIQKELSELHFEDGQIEKAKHIGIKGALNFGEREKKDGLFFLLGQIFQKSQERQLAFKHFMLSQLIRSEQGWYVPNKLKVALEDTYTENLQYTNVSVLYNELLKFWKTTFGVAKADERNRKVGRIGQLNESKQIGKIFDGDGTPFFFHFNDFKDRRERLRTNLDVEFSARPPKESGQGKNWIAFDIKILQQRNAKS